MIRKPLKTFAPTPANATDKGSATGLRMDKDGAKELGDLPRTPTIAMMSLEPRADAPSAILRLTGTTGTITAMETGPAFMDGAKAHQDDLNQKI